MSLWRFGLLTLIVGVLCGASTTGEAADVTVYLEDFEYTEAELAYPGYFDFTSDHTYYAPPPSTNNPGQDQVLWGVQTYTVDGNPNDWHSGWASFGDHTSGSGKMMIINAANIPDPSTGRLGNCDVTVWEGPEIVVAPGVVYAISYYVKLSTSTAPPRLVTSVNGTEIGSFDEWTTATQTNGWFTVTHTWNAGSATTAVIRICDSRTVYDGDDYVLDDISLGRAWLWDEETAWAAGTRYSTDRGNWATYTSGSGGPATLFAGRNWDAGTVTITELAGGSVRITITLHDEWRFALVDDNVKVQDYDEAPSGNPSPGLFAWKTTAPTDASAPAVATIVVPENFYYGIHVDVERRH